MENEFVFKVPSGIGDLSWIYSKLVNFERPFSLVVCGDQPQRTLPFAQLLPKVRSACYGDFGYWQTFMIEQKGLSSETDLTLLKPGEYYLSANRHLEVGNRLEDFLPNLATNFHYDFNRTSNYLVDVGFEGKAIGVYTSKYTNYNGDWKFWSADEWTEFLRSVSLIVGPCTFFFLGADFDGELGFHVEEKVRRFAHTVQLVGKTHIGEVINLLGQLDYLFAYPSGIGILGDVVDVPTMHFLPTPRHDNLVNTYADRKNVRSGRHLNQLFCTVDQAVKVFRKKGVKFT